MFRGSVILFALAVNVKVIWQALYDQTIGVDVAVIHFLVAMPICGILLAIFRMATEKHPMIGRNGGGDRPGAKGATGPGAAKRTREPNEPQ